MKKSELFFTALLVPLDFSMIVLAALAAYFLRFTPYFVKIRPILFYLPLSKYIILVLGIAPLLILIFAIVGLYKITRRRLIDDLYGVFIGVLAGIAILSFVIFLRAELFESRFLIIASGFLSILFVILGRLFIRIIQRQLYRYGIGVHRVVLIGNTCAAINLARDFEKPLSGFRVVSKIKEFNESTLKLLAKIGQKPGIDEIIQTDPSLSKERMLDLIDFAYESKVDIKYIPDLFELKQQILM
jgi:FlaA1/EpsC-like NDP-sugar epimerase